MRPTCQWVTLYVLSFLPPLSLILFLHPPSAGHRPMHSRPPAAARMPATRPPAAHTLARPHRMLGNKSYTTRVAPSRWLDPVLRLTSPSGRGNLKEIPSPACCLSPTVLTSLPPAPSHPHPHAAAPLDALLSADHRF
jgi:hypothetical protein